MKKIRPIIILSFIFVIVFSYTYSFSFNSIKQKYTNTVESVKKDVKDIKDTVKAISAFVKTTNDIISTISNVLPIKVIVVLILSSIIMIILNAAGITRGMTAFAIAMVIIDIFWYRLNINLYKNARLGDIFITNLYVFLPFIIIWSIKYIVNFYIVKNKRSHISDKNKAEQILFHLNEIERLLNDK